MIPLLFRKEVSGTADYNIINDIVVIISRIQVDKKK